MIILTTHRLQLKEFSTDDAEFIFRLLNSPGWLKYIGTRNISKLEDAENYILNKLVPGYKEHGFGFYLVQIKSTNEKIGMCGLVKRETLDDVDIGFAFLPEFEGKGYAFESSSAVIEYAKKTLGLNQLAAITVPYNEPSIKLLEKLGLKFDKTVSLPGDNETLMYFKMDLREIMSENQYTLTDNTGEKQFELKTEGGTAVVEYELLGNKIIFTHTEVPKELEGKGIGSKIVKLALENIDSRRLKLIPLCPFTAQYIKRHPEWEHVLADNVNIKG